MILTEILGEFLFCFETGQIWDRINGQSLREPALVGWLNFPWETRPVLTSVFRRLQGYRWWLGELEKNEGGIEKFAEGYKIFGWNRDNEKGWDDGIGWGHGVGLDILGWKSVKVGVQTPRSGSKQDNLTTREALICHESCLWCSAGGYVYREWLPNAKQALLAMGVSSASSPASSCRAIVAGVLDRRLQRLAEHHTIDIGRLWTMGTLRQRQGPSNFDGGPPRDLLENFSGWDFWVMMQASPPKKMACFFCFIIIIIIIIIILHLHQTDSPHRQMARLALTTPRKSKCVGGSKTMGCWKAWWNLSEGFTVKGYRPIAIKKNSLQFSVGI